MSVLLTRLGSFKGFSLIYYNKETILITAPFDGNLD